MRKAILLVMMFVVTEIVFAQNMDGLNVKSNTAAFRTEQVSSTGNYQVLQSFPSPGGAWIGDIAYDGENIWVGTGDYNLYKVSPQDGSILDTLKIDLYTIDGLAFDGKFLWVAETYGERKVYKIDPKTNQVVKKFKNNYSDFTHGIHFKDGRLYVNMFFLSSVNATYVLDTATFDIVDKIPNGFSFAHGISYDGTNYWISANGLAATNNTGIDAFIYKIDPITFAHIDSFPAPGGGYPNGLTFDGQYLWASNADARAIYKIDIGNVVTDVSGSSLKEVKVKMYPNPATSTLYVEAAKYSVIEVRDVEGKIIEKYAMDYDAQAFDISGLTNGVYYLKIPSEKGTVTKKLVKQ